MHGDQDLYFPPEHARQLYMAAREPKELWLLPGMGHAEAASSQELVDRIARWIDQATARPATPESPAPAPSPPGRRSAPAAADHPAVRLQPADAAAAPHAASARPSPALPTPPAHAPPDPLTDF